MITFSQRVDKHRTASGLGKYLFKVEVRPGIPVKAQITKTEQCLHDANARWRAS